MTTPRFIALFSVAFLTVTPAMAAKISANVNVKNSSSWSIHQLYISPASQSDWGPDQLGTEILGTGGSYELTSIPCDRYDVKLIDEDSDECVVNAVNICGSSETWEITDADLLSCQAETAATAKPTQASITIKNQSAWEITRLYLSPVTDQDWGPDQLGTEVISTGGSFDLTDIPCASYDVKLIDEDGDECVVNGADICGGSDSWVIKSEDLLACQAG